MHVSFVGGDRVDGVAHDLLVQEALALDTFGLILFGNLRAERLDVLANKSTELLFAPRLVVLVRPVARPNLCGFTHLHRRVPPSGCPNPAGRSSASHSHAR